MKITDVRPLLFLFCGFFNSCQNHSTTPDNDFDVTVTESKLSGQRVVFDQGHKNHHQIDRTYKPFANLLRNDGCTVESTDKPIDASILSTCDIFIIATAMGKEEPGDKSPFSDNEINNLVEWVKNGGSILLITEHYPFGLAMELLLKKIWSRGPQWLYRRFDNG